MLSCIPFLSLVTWGKSSLAMMGKYGRVGPQIYKCGDIELLYENVGLHDISDTCRGMLAHTPYLSLVILCMEVCVLGRHVGP